MTNGCSYSLLKPLSWWPNMLIWQHKEVKYKAAIFHIGVHTNTIDKYIAAFC